ncbi:MAG: HYR domain-containing protein [Bacteroidales bacterium]
MVLYKSWYTSAHIVSKSIFIAFSILLFSQVCFGQNASSTWSLTSNGTPVIVGALNATGIVGGPGLIGAITYSPEGSNASGWNSTGLDLGDYYQYSIAPKAGNICTISQIYFTQSISSGSMSAAVYYSEDGFSTAGSPIGEIFTVSTFATVTSMPISIVVPDGQYFTIRIYGWGAISATRKFHNKDVVIEGTSCLLPEVYHITGGGSFCEGGLGPEIGLDGSDLGIGYELLNNLIPTGNIVSGTEDEISFGNITIAGNYNILATRFAGGCTENMDGSVTVTVKPLPTLTDATQASPVNVNEPAVINLFGLLPTSAFSLDFKINNIAQVTITGLEADESGTAIFATPLLTAQNNGQILQITHITLDGATPQCGAVFSEEVILQVIDPIAIANCPFGSILLNTESGLCTGTANYNITVAGTPTPTTTYTFSGATLGSGSGTGSGSAFNIDTTLVVITAANIYDTATCTFNVTVSDNIPPTITCPAAISVFTNSGCTATSVNLGVPVTNDNCGVASVTNNAPTAFPLGTTTVLWTVTDNVGLTATCNQTVTVSDNVPPSITCPAPVSVFTNSVCTATSVNLGVPVTNDNCGVASVTNNAPTAFPLGTTTVIWTVTDNAGLTATCSQTVTVSDNDPPTITCPAAVSVFTNSGCTATSVNLGVPLTNDNCGVALVANNAPTAFPLGITTVIWTITDNAGLTATCNQTVMVSDNVPPSITCPAAISVFTNSGCTATSVNLGVPLTNDNCGVALVANNAPTAFPLGITTVIWTITDNAGLTATCNQTVMVSDNVPPSITCPAAISVFTNSGCTATSVNLGVPLTNDNCGVASVTNNAPTVFLLGTTIVIWTVTDNAGLTATCSQTVTVSDNVPPSITCPANISQNSSTGSCNATVIVPSPTFSDNCGVNKLTWTMTGATVASSPSSGINTIGTYLFNAGITMIIYTVSDASLNTINCSFSVSIIDNTPPAISGCPANNTVFTGLNRASCDQSAVWVEPTATDNCTPSGSLIWTKSHTSGSIFPVGSTSVAYTVKDLSNNISYCNFTITLNPQTKVNQSGLTIF